MDPYNRSPEGYEPDVNQRVPTPDSAETPDDWLDDGATELEYETPRHVTPTSVFCVQCGYNLTGVAIGSTCPECGRTVAPSFHGQMLPTSGKAIASLVLGICSIVGCVFYGIPSLICGPLAIIFALMAKRQVADAKAGGSSAGMATAGLVCGIVGLCLVLITIAIVILIIVLDSM